MTNERTAIRTTYFSIVGNTVLAIIKGAAGFFGNSYALIADAIESTTDIAVSYTHLRAHETVLDLVCRLLLEKKNTPI